MVKKQSVLVSGEIGSSMGRQEFYNRFLDNFSLDFETANKDVDIVLPINNINVNFIFNAKKEMDGFIFFGYMGYYDDGQITTLMQITSVYDNERQLTQAFIMIPSDFEVNS